MIHKTFRYSLYVTLIIYILYTIKPYASSEIDKLILPHYQEFMSLLETECTEDQYFHPNFKMQIKELEDDAIGVCIIRPKSFTIYLDKQFWEKSEELDRFQVVAHELIHCMFYQDHVEDKKHFMAPNFVYIPKEVLYKQIKDMLKDKCR